jgi:hypothetical protein
LVGFRVAEAGVARLKRPNRPARSARAERPQTRRPGREDAYGLLRLLARIGFDLVAIAGEMLAIPVRLWMRAAETAGAIVLAVAEIVWALLVATWQWAGGLVTWSSRVATPARATVAVAAVAAVALGASQFADYRTVDIGAPQYAAVESVAPAPEVASRDPRSAHGDWLLLIAAAGLAVVGVSAVARPRFARMLVPLGLGAVAVAILHDHGVGLQTGRAGIAYEGAQAVLLPGYWAEIAAGAVLAACGPLITLNALPGGAGRRVARRERPLAGSRSHPAGAAG